LPHVLRQRLADIVGFLELTLLVLADEVLVGAGAAALNKPGLIRR
jgi:hypothetical protein